MSKYKIICLGSTRAVGKDTLYSLLKEIDGQKFTRIAFADGLKERLQSVCYSFFNKSIEELTAQEKELFRPLLITTGKLGREIDENYWIKNAAIIAQKLSDNGFVPVITDLRYASEANYFKNIYGDSMFLVNIERDGAPPPTDEEKIHGPEVAKMADVTLKWHSDETLASLRPIVKEFYDKYLA